MSFFQADFGQQAAGLSVRAFRLIGVTRTQLPDDGHRQQDGQQSQLRQCRTERLEDVRPFASACGALVPAAPWFGGGVFTLIVSGSMSCLPPSSITGFPARGNIVRLVFRLARNIPKPISALDAARPRRTLAA